MKAENKDDCVDARKMVELLYLNKLNSDYHGETRILTFEEVIRRCPVITTP